MCLPGARPVGSAPGRPCESNTELAFEPIGTMNFTHDGKAAIATILRCMIEAEKAFSSLNADENKACFDFHNENGSLNHCLRWGLTAAQEIHAAVTHDDEPLNQQTQL